MLPIRLVVLVSLCLTLSVAVHVGDEHGAAKALEATAQLPGIPDYNGGAPRQVQMAGNVAAQETSANIPWHYPLFIAMLLWIHIYVYNRDNPAPIVAVIYLLYLTLHTLSAAMQVVVGRESKSPVSMAQAVIFAALSVKLAISGSLTTMECMRDGTSFPESVRLFKAALITIFVPSMLYTSGDLVLVFCQQNMSMTEVQIIQKVGIPITAVVWYCIFRITISPQKVIGITVLMIGTCIYAYGQQKHLGQATAEPPAPPGPLGALPVVWVFRLFMLAQAMLSTCGGVANEYCLLKTEASVNMMNTAMYTEGIIFVILQSKVMGSPLPVVAMLEFGVMEWGLVSIYAFMGICTSFVLKYLGSVWKQVGYGVMLVLFFAVDNFFLGSTYEQTAIFGVLVCTIGVCMYVYAGIQADTRAEQIGKEQEQKNGK
jgi:drug/metabolite transporter (DMT)-like permease